MTRIRGSEKLDGGYSVIVVVVTPAVKAAGTSIPLPTQFQGAEDLLALTHFVGSDGTAAAVANIRTIVARGTSAPSAGQACLYDDNNLRLGDATTTKDLLLCIIKYKSFTMEL